MSIKNLNKFALSLILLVFLIFQSCNRNSSKAGNDWLYGSFKDPQEKYSPGAWWWWNGNALTKKEITRQLDIFVDAGMHSVSITPMEMPEDVIELPVGFKELEWMSPEWKEMLAFTLEEAEKRKIECHISVGQGWPLGDILEKYPNEIVITSTFEIERPGYFKGNAWELFKLPFTYTQRLRTKTLVDSAIIALRLVPAEPEEFTTGVDLLPEIEENGDFSCQIPEGKYKIYITQWQKGYSKTKHNPDHHIILNYLNKQAVLETMDSAYAKYTEIPGADKLVSLYHDSWELDEMNWTADFPAEFKKRRGYDLFPYLPFVSNFYITEPETETAFYDTIQYVRYDMITTLVELFEERTLQPLSEWNHKHGYSFRNQSYGREQHPLDANFYTDIPEGEAWIINDEPNVSMINRYVSSAARLTGKNIITCETNTNVYNTFRLSLDQVKRTTDLTFISGMNQLFLHGYNYSPAEAGIPGWARYGTFFSVNNPWWPYVKKYTTYIRRLSFIMQNTIPQANIALYTPDADIWKKQSREFKPYPENVEPWYIYDLWKAVHTCGYNTNYLSDRVISESEVVNGQIIFNGHAFDLLILEDVHSIPLETIKKLEITVEKGGKLALIGQTPGASAGYLQAKTKGEEIKKIVANLIQNHPGRVKVFPSPDKDQNLTAFVSDILQKMQVQPDLDIQNPSEEVTQVYHTIKGKDIFFVVNSNPEKDKELIIKLPDDGKNTSLWDPQTGERFNLTVDNNSLKLMLPAASSWLLVRDHYKPDAPLYNYSSPEFKNQLSINDWKIHCHHITGEVFQYNTTELSDLSKNEKFRNFAGVLSYEAHFEIDDKFKTILIPAEKSVTDLYINDQLVGSNYYGRHQYNVEKYLKQGSNTIKINVTTTLGNFMDGKDALAKRWKKNVKPIKTGIYENILTD